MMAQLTGVADEFPTRTPQALLPSVSEAMTETATHTVYSNPISLIQSRVPGEVWTKVLLNLKDRRDIAHLLQTCHKIKFQAERTLYRTLVIRNTHSPLLFRLGTLPPHLADLVYSLDISDLLCESLLFEQAHIRQALCLLRNLKVLSVPETRCVRSKDSDSPFPFRLIEFAARSFSPVDVRPFFNSQPSIEILSWDSWDIYIDSAANRSTPHFDDDLLPNLTTLQTKEIEVIRDVLRPSTTRKLKRLAIACECSLKSEMEGLSPQPLIQVLVVTAPLSAAISANIQIIFPNLIFLECLSPFGYEVGATNV